MPSLDVIQEEIANILQVAEELDDTQQLPALQYLDELAIQEQSKVDAIGYAVRKRKAEIDFLKQEEERLRHRRQSMENRLEEFRDYLLVILNRHKLTKVKGLSSTLFIRNVSSVKIEDLADIPEDFKQVITDIKIDKAGIGKAFKMGWKVPGASLEPKQSLTIR